jgi:hypothetical protein
MLRPALSQPPSILIGEEGQSDAGDVFDRHRSPLPKKILKGETYFYSDSRASAQYAGVGVQPKKFLQTKMPHRSGFIKPGRPAIGG